MGDQMRVIIAAIGREDQLDVGRWVLDVRRFLDQ
jgi:hypothetical protein